MKGTLSAPAYLLRVADVGRTQALASTVGFAAWIFAIGGPFERLSWYEPIYGAILLVLYMTVASSLDYSS